VSVCGHGGAIRAGTTSHEPGVRHWTPPSLRVYVDGEMRENSFAGALLRRRRVAALLVLSLVVLLVQVVPAGAVPRPTTPTVPPQARSNTEMTVSGWSPGRGVTGYIADSDNPFDPGTDAYPPGNPGAGWTAKNEGFAGVIHGTPTGGGAILKLYCIDINTDTTTGIGYGLGSWNAGGVSPSVGYVARLLNDYYPHTDEPAALTDPNDRAAAVQAAIWFFSDRYVLSTTDPLRDAVTAIVNDVKSKGPLVEPPPPSLTVTPPSVSGPAGSAVGPFTVRTDTGRRRPRASTEATVTATGGSMFSDPAGTVPLGDPATVPSGQKIWMRSKGGSTSAVLQAKATATVPSGNVYLYDGNAGVNDAQRLILAEYATLTTTVQATAQFLPPGSLVVKKKIAGPAAGSQGPIVIHVACTDGVERPDVTIAARTPAGVTSKTYEDVPAGVICTVIETSTGSVAGTGVVVTGTGQQVTIPSGKSTTVDVTDTYHSVITPLPGVMAGSLLITKTIAGPLAGHQGPIGIQVTCNGTATADFTIDAGTPAGSVSHSVDGIPAGSACIVTETADGATDAVSATVSGNGQQVTIPAGQAVPVNLIDVYQGTPGTLEVIKTIAGSAARGHGGIAILAACGGPLHTYVYRIPAHTAADSVPRYFNDIPAGARCTVTEVATGGTRKVPVVAIGRRHTVTIRANAKTIVRITDAFRRIVNALPPVTTG